MPQFRHKEVAPLVGAWIEIIVVVNLILDIASLLSWERGLKYRHTLTYLAAVGRSSRGSVD